MNSGKIVITLEEYRKAHNISKYKIIKNCDVSETQFNIYCNNKISRVDLPVLARICSYLDCDIGDLLKFITPDDIAEDENNT